MGLTTPSQSVAPRNTPRPRLAPSDTAFRGLALLANVRQIHLSSSTPPSIRHHVFYYPRLKLLMEHDQTSP